VLLVFSSEENGLLGKSKERTRREREERGESRMACVTAVDRRGDQVGLGGQDTVG
jgi:hypothetical protein